MYLKRIELNGFKSFADPVTIEFNEGITCIVGPNGSGKSNISDAIRWVLGEQSPKMLRGSRMDEVIFAGTQNRKPKGMAEVTLVIDNSDGQLPIDFSEVGITRRMYRSGESEYLINRAPCRLRDIRELIMDTGIGVEGYSIIGQGKIADIIDNKMDSRREIFEEAAGVVKYRTRKAEAERKLESASGNLDRVNDIVREIEGRIDGLREDSEKATEYLALKEKYQRLEVNIILKNIQAAESRTDSAAEEQAELQQALDRSEEERGGIDRQLRENREQGEALETALSGLQDELLKKNDELHFIENRRQLNEERLTTLDRDKEKLHEEIDSLSEKIEREKNNAASTREAAEAVRSEVRSAQDALQAKQRGVEEARNLLAAAEGRKTEAGSAARDASAKAAQLRIDRTQVAARERLLEELERSYEGYGGGVRFLMEQDLPGVIGILGDLITVPKGCEVAVETALGAQMQNIVCDDDATAKEAIALLKASRAGRLTFLPVASLRPQKPIDCSDLEGESGYLGLASELVRIEGGHQNVLDYTLGRVAICKALPDAIRFSKQVSGMRFVTLEGDIINAAGAITGGSLKNNTGNILSRKAEKDDLKKRIAALDEQIASCEREIRKEQEKAGEVEASIEAARAALEEARRAETEAMLAESNARVRAGASKELEDRMAQSLRELESDLAARRKALESIDVQKAEIAAFTETAALATQDKENEKAAIEAKIAETTAARKDLQAAAARLEDERRDAESRRYELQMKKHDADVRIARFEAQTDSLKEKLWEEFELSYAQAAEKEDPDFVLTRAVRESRECRDRMRELGDVNVGAIEEYKAVSERYGFLTAQRSDLLQAIGELNAVIEDMDKTIIRRYKESFDAVVENFESTFTELFKGGHARLTMSDPNDPLESTIEIEAQPPGKKLQNMNLLSGGEKTMTAIALMFAVLKAKPTPFCILDEVEAALDEANIDCFARYLRNFKETQFALVTHQKVTMEYADVLYGVTMPEHGITRVLSLRVGDEFEL